MREDSFAARLYKARTATGMSQTRLGEGVGVRGSQISEFEHGRADADEYTVRMLAKALNVDATWLRGRPKRMVTVEEVIRRG